MKIIYITNARLPTEWAHGLQIMKTCGALAESGVEIKVLTPARAKHITESPFSYYEIKKEFPIQRIPTLDWVTLGKIGFLIQMFSFAVNAFFRLSAEEKRSVIYCRDEMIVVVLGLLGLKNIIWESHSGAWNVWARRAVTYVRHIVVVSNGLKEFYIHQGIRGDTISVIPNGIDLSAYREMYSRESIRTELGIPQNKKIALYVGMLNGWKGADTLLHASDLLPDDTMLAVIGGEDRTLIARLSKSYPKVLFLGFRASKELARNLASADVLVLSNTAKNSESAYFTSPLKLFAYMASKKPIVLPDLPAMREILSDDSAYFVEPDNAEALARGIEEALNNGEESVMRASGAYERVKGYTWENRAKKIMNLIMAESSL